MRCGGPTFEFPGEAAEDKQPPSRTSGLQARRGAAHFARPSWERQCQFRQRSTRGRINRPRLPLGGSYQDKGGVRGRKVQPRIPSVQCEGKKPAGSLSAVRAVLRLTHLRCWVVPGRDSSSSAGSGRRVPPLHSAVRLRRVNTCLLFLHTSAGKNPARSVPGRQDTAVRIRSRLLAQTVTGFRFAAPATDCAGGMVPGLTAASLLPSIREWAVPSQAPEGVCPPTTSVSSAVPGSLASPFHGAPEPAAPHAARHPPGPRSTSFRALGHWETLSRAAARTASRTGTTSHASPTRLRDSQQPRPTRKLTPHPQ